jgi:hypothetical protein
VFNGDGQNSANLDKNVDVMGRAWIAPFALGSIDAIKAVELGGSFWLGKRTKGGNLGSQFGKTQGGFAFVKPTWTGMAPMMGGTAPSFELRQHGDLKAFAAELDLPIDHKYVLRGEYVHRDQDLASNTSGALPAKLKGDGVYGQLGVWVLGDDKIIGAPGLQLPGRIKKFGTSAPRLGLELLARLDYVDEQVTPSEEATAMAPGNPAAGHTKVTSFELGANFWYSKRFRATVNYLYNHFAGDAPYVTGLAAKNEHEFAFRLGIAL